jgi:hypothetical protein
MKPNEKLPLIMDHTAPLKQFPQVRMAARICLIALSVCIGADLLSIWQTYYQLVSPLIPRSIIDSIVGPIVSITILSSICFVAGWVLFYFRRHVWVIVICGLAIIWQAFHRYLA